MKEIYYVKTEAYNMLVSVDPEYNCRYLMETDEFPYLASEKPDDRKQKVLEFLESVEDDSSWRDDCTYEQIFDEYPVEIIARIRKEI